MLQQRFLVLSIIASTFAVPTPAQDNVAQRFGTGVVQGAVGLGAANLIIHPIDSVKNIGQAITHPVRTTKAVGHNIKDCFETDVANCLGKSTAVIGSAFVGGAAISSLNRASQAGTAAKVVSGAADASAASASQSLAIVPFKAAGPASLQSASTSGSFIPSAASSGSMSGAASSVNSATWSSRAGAAADATKAGFASGSAAVSSGLSAIWNGTKWVMTSPIQASKWAASGVGSGITAVWNGAKWVVTSPVEASKAAVAGATAPNAIRAGVGAVGVGVVADAGFDSRMENPNGAFW